MRQDGVDRRGVPDQDVGDPFDIVEIDHRNARLRQRLVGGDRDDGGVIEMEQRLADVVAASETVRGEASTPGLLLGWADSHTMMV